MIRKSTQKLGSFINQHHTRSYFEIILFGFTLKQIEGDTALKPICILGQELDIAEKSHGTKLTHLGHSQVN